MFGYAAMFDFLQFFQKDQNIVAIGFYRYLYFILIRKHLFHAYIVSDFGRGEQAIKVLKKFLFFLTYLRKYVKIKISIKQEETGMKYDLSAIMKKAWQLVKRFGFTISSALKKSWRDAKTNYIAVKEWFFDKEQEKAEKYNVFMDFARNEDGTQKIENGYIFAKVEEIMKESEKAIQVRVSTGEVVGSYKGWICWIPKSLIK
jgi:hypothetical protein